MRFVLLSALVAVTSAAALNVGTTVSFSTSTTLAAPSSAPSVPSAPPAAPSPTVGLDYAKFTGKSSNGIDSFLGMPFAQPPVGPLRFNLPLAPKIPKIIPSLNASAYGPSCFQLSAASGLGNGVPSSVVDTISFTPFAQPANSSSEDCLSINVIRPSPSASAPALLPILVWIYGGGFELGSSSGNDGTPIVARSIKNGEPIIYISMNYRLSGFGFMSGKQVKAEGRYATSFGGDPTRVTMFGESAGAISAVLQTVAATYKTESNLFSSIIALSGATFPTGPIDSAPAQVFFDTVAVGVGCASTPTLDCLRAVSYEVLAKAIDQTPAIFAYQSNHNLAWRPRVDGTFLLQDPQLLAEAQLFNRVPMINGDCDDEGTLFSVTNTNITTYSDFTNYVAQQYAPTLNATEIVALGATLAQIYPMDPVQGSPFGTGYRNVLTPLFKTVAAFTGDIVFQAPRRHFLYYYSPLSPTWSYIYKRNKNTPFLGSFHSSDITTEIYAPGVGSSDGQFQFIDYIINFVLRSDPNPVNPALAPNLLYWPGYSIATPNMLTWLDRPLGGVLGLSITFDDFRAQAMKTITAFTIKYTSTT